MSDQPQSARPRQGASCGVLVLILAFGALAAWALMTGQLSTFVSGWGQGPAKVARPSATALPGMGDPGSISTPSSGQGQDSQQAKTVYGVCSSTALDVDIVTLQEAPQIRSILDKLVGQKVDVNYDDVVTDETFLYDAVVADVSCDGASDLLVLVGKQAKREMGIARSGVLYWLEPGSYTIRHQLVLPELFDGDLALDDVTGDWTPEILVQGERYFGGMNQGGNNQSLSVVTVHPEPRVHDVCWFTADVSYRDLDFDGVLDVVYTGRRAYVCQACGVLGPAFAKTWSNSEGGFVALDLAHESLVSTALISITDAHRVSSDDTEELTGNLNGLREAYGDEVYAEALGIWTRANARKSEVRTVLLDPSQDVQTGMRRAASLLEIADTDVAYAIVSDIMAEEYIVGPDGALRQFREVENQLLGDVTGSVFGHSQANPVVESSVTILADYHGVPLTDEEKYFVSVALTYSGKQVLVAATDETRSMGNRVVYVKHLPNGQSLYLPTLTENESKQIADIMTHSYSIYGSAQSGELLSQILSDQGIEMPSTVSAEHVGRALGDASSAVRAIDFSASVDVGELDRTVRSVDNAVRSFSQSSTARSVASSMGARVSGSVRSASSLLGF